LVAVVGTARAGDGVGDATAEGWSVGCAGGGALAESPSAISGGSLSRLLGAAMALDTWIMKPHLRHFMRTDRPATFSSAIWYFALQLGQRNFIQRSAVAQWALVFEETKNSEGADPRKSGPRA
jgi:hypothetical protein